MKWIALASVILILTSCGFTRNTEVLEYRKIVVETPIVAKPVYNSKVLYSQEPNYRYRKGLYYYNTPATYYIAPSYYGYVAPVDVTTTTVEYY